MIAASPVDRPGVHKPVVDTVVQEIDIKTGLVLFDWHALDHVPLSESYKYGSGRAGTCLRPLPHQLDLDRPRRQPDRLDAQHLGDLRDRPHDRPGDLAAGRKALELQVRPGTRTAFQHDAIVHPDGTLTIFDDGAGPPQGPPLTRAGSSALDTRA